MLVTRSGKLAGSVSNGCIEGAVFEEAQKVLGTGEPRLLAYGVADELAFEVGLACGGHIEVFVQPATAEHLELARLVAADAPAILRTNLKSGDVALEKTAPDENSPFRHDGWFIEPYPRAPQLVIVGAIHIAIPLHRMGKLMGCRVVVADARAKFATRERFPDADELLVGWPDDVLPSLTIDRSTAVVILTHDPKFDLPALRAALHSSAGYIGAIGSRKTNENRFARLREDGFNDAQIARVHGPIGLDLGGRSAEETALAIMAEITAVRHAASGTEMRQVRSARG
jgi:xanthine dehydrogenase accessory factor